MPGTPPTRRPAGGLTAEPCPFADRLSAEATKVSLPLSLVIAVAWRETRCRHEGQRSPKGAIGLMQLMPATAHRFGADDPWNIDQNVAADFAYLAWLNTRYDGDRYRTERRNRSWRIWG